MLEEAGFNAVEIRRKAGSREIIRSWNFDFRAEDLVFSADIVAVKPRTTGD